MKVNKTKEKESQHDPEYAADKEETPVSGHPQNVEQCFIAMVEVALLSEQEKVRHSRRDSMHEGLLIN